MLKNFTARATLPITISITGFVVVCCIVLYSFIKKDLVNNTILHQVSLADTIVKTTRYTMLKSDRETLFETINHIGEQKDVEYVRIFNKKGLIVFTSDPTERQKLVDKKAAGCAQCHTGDKTVTYLGPMEKARQIKNASGDPVIAVTAPIYNEDACAGMGCHANPRDMRILGTLDIGLTAVPLAQNLATLRLRMIVFCLMVLMITVGGTCALLRRNVFLPLRELVSFTETLKSGNIDVQEPRGSQEIEAIGKAIHEIAEKKQPVRGPGGTENAQKPASEP